MIIQCEQCQTKFKLDDSKVADKSIKVRCARCRHVFSVVGIQAVPEISAAFEQKAPVFQIEDELEDAAESSLSFKPDTPPEEDSSKLSSLLDSFSFAEDDKQAAPDSPPSPSNELDLFFPSMDSAASDEQAETQKVSGMFDFGDEYGDSATPFNEELEGLDFSGDDLFGDAATPPKEEFGGLDFSGDDLFGEVVSTPPEEAASDSISLDEGMVGFADSFGGESSAAGQSSSFAAQNPAAENPFSLDDIDFGDDLTSVAVQQISPEELKPSQDLLFAPLAKTETKPVPGSAADTLEKTAAPSDQEEPPPLSITSRRKESPRISGMIVFMGILIVGLAGFYGYWGFVTMNEDKGQITQETGRITVRSVEASFIKNTQTGDLLVISGEAVNDYNKPRAAIQVKGTVFGPDGNAVSSKSAFCGNPLSREQLATMTMDKIEAAMANQFGDSLTNMEVAPGDAIPFVIVIPKPPAGATDYGVEPVGSTVSTGKDK